MIWMEHVMPLTSSSGGLFQDFLDLTCRRRRFTVLGEEKSFSVSSTSSTGPNSVTNYPMFRRELRSGYPDQKGSQGATKLRVSQPHDRQGDHLGDAGVGRAI